MKLAVDVDDVIGAFGAEIVRFCNRYGRSSDAPLWTLDDLTDFDSFKCLNLEHLKDRFHQHLIDTEYCRHMEVLPGAQEFIEQLRKLGQVVFVTSPHSAIPAWSNQREAWLIEHFGASKDDIVHTSGKHHVNADFLIDDKYENCESFPGHAICFDRPWNRQPGMRLRAYDYVDVIGLIQAHAL